MIFIFYWLIPLFKVVIFKTYLASMLLIVESVSNFYSKFKIINFVELLIIYGHHRLINQVIFNLFFISYRNIFFEIIQNCLFSNNFVCKINLLIILKIKKLPQWLVIYFLFLKPWSNQAKFQDRVSGNRFFS